MNYHDNRFGTAQFADYQMIGEAGLYSAQSGLFLGHDDIERALRSDSMSAVWLCGGARSGKGNHILPWLIDGHYNDHVINMDWKFQLGAVSQLQVLQGRHVINFDPRGHDGFVSHRINPLSHLKGNSPTLIPDAKLTAGSILPFSGSTNAEYFEATGQGWIEVAAVGLARLKGDVTFPELADLMLRFGTLSDEWLSFEERLAEMPEPFIQKVVDDAKQLTEMTSTNGGGLLAVKSDVAKAFASMSDPQLRAAVSPPYDFCFSELVKPQSVPTIVNIAESMEYAESSAPVLKALYTNALIYKSRALGARRQLWNLDEIGNVDKWPLAVKMATYAAGIGIRTVYVTQSRQQLNNLAPNAGKVIPNSCGTQIFKGIRSEEEALPISRMLGTQTIEHEDFHTNQAADQESWTAFYNAAVKGEEESPWDTFAAMSQAQPYVEHRVKAPRPLRTTDELLAHTDEEAVVFMPGTLRRPALVTAPKYWTRRELAGRFLEDPYHAEGGYVSARTGWGQQKRRVITERVPSQYAHYPQYAHGYWSYVQGYRPR